METSFDTKSLAAHVIVTLSEAQAEGRALRLDEVASEIGVRKADVRNVVTRLHAEGHVDALRLRLTMTGPRARHHARELQAARYAQAGRPHPARGVSGTLTALRRDVQALTYGFAA